MIILILQQLRDLIIITLNETGLHFKMASANVASYTGFVNGDKVTVAVTGVIKNTPPCSSTFNTLTIHVNPLPTGTLIPVENYEGMHLMTAISARVIQ